MDQSNNIDDGIELVVLGTANAGKSHYLAAVVGQEFIYDTQFALRGGNDFSIRSLDLLWDNIQTREGANRRLAETTSLNEYKLRLMHGSRPLSIIRWIDYTGGGLLADPSLADTIRSHLMQSRGIIIMLSAEHMMHPLWGDENRGRLQQIRQRSGAKHIAVHLNSYAEAARAPLEKQPDLLNKRAGRLLGLPVVVAVSKSDLLKAGEDWKIDPLQIVKNVRALFPELFELGERTFRTLIAPVALGTDLGPDMSTGEIDPVDVHLPIAFLMEHYFNEQAWYARQSLSQLERDSETWKTSRLQSILNSLGIDWKSETMKSNMDQIEKFAEKIADDIDKLGSVFRQNPSKFGIYFNGKKLGIDDFKWNS